MQMENLRFNTKLLHGKTSGGYSQREILPPVSQVTAFSYENMEELEKVFSHKIRTFMTGYGQVP